MANNGGRQGGAAGVSNTEHVEFTVKAEEDLYLTGSENTIRRVTADTNYSCLMLKTQRFSSLFRHYAKYHGLRKDDLEYYFVNPLENEDTPESVQLQRGDTIMVRKRRRPEPPEAVADDGEFYKDMRELLDDEDHKDVKFLVYSESGKQSSSAQQPGKKRCITGEIVTSTRKEMTKIDDLHAINTSNCVAVIKENDSIGQDGHENTAYMEIRAHKCILTARGDYFKALFRKYPADSSGHVRAFKESKDFSIYVEPDFSARVVRLMLEFIYTNRISSLPAVSTEDLLSLLHLSDFWSLRDCKRVVELQLISSHIDVNSVARLYCATEDYNAKRLAKACIEFIMDNIREVAGNLAFQEEMKNYPHLCIPVLKAAADLIPEPLHKKQRTSDHSMPTATPTGVATTSSPVPDSDT